MMSRLLLRSVLFTPGDRIKLMQKALALRPDAMVIDLEDAVKPDSSTKNLARANVQSFLDSMPSVTANQSNSLITVRVNCPLSSSFGEEDINMIRSRVSQLHAIVLPKVNDRDTVDRILQLLHASNRTDVPITKIWAMIETAKGVRNVNDIADHPNVETIIFGSNDLAKDLRIGPSPTNPLPLLYSKSQCVIAARSATTTTDIECKYAIDGVFMDIKNPAGLTEESSFAKSMGFDGKTLIHPDQIGPVNTAFSPSKKEFEYAMRVKAAYQAAQAEGKSLAVLDGKLIEYLHVQQAEEVIRVHNLLH